MPLLRRNRSVKWLTFLSRSLLKRLEAPSPSYEKRIINNMDNLYRVIRKGDVVLVEGRSELSRFIKVLTQSSWSHSAFYVGDALDGSGMEDVRRALDDAGDRDRRHMLVEADTGKGVIAVPLSKYGDYNIRICRPFGISTQDLEMVEAEVIRRIGRHYDHHNILDLAVLLLPPSLNPFKQRTIKACLGGCSEYEVICSGMIAQAFQKVGYPIVPALIQAENLHNNSATNPYGSQLIMRHYSQIVPRDFDLSPNFEIVKYNIIGMGEFDYKSIWAARAVME
ncbi:YiiX/YebB-like N1pC/P60 family cysteine hydrolase [Desulfococcus sp.]|uniref:YiiX/YebB-like N1pC/P60 family cysteine hydrolase n=1 Tax=Desulfococcus sp. TaxID=2025834 RepID=UPI0035937FB5